MNVHSDKNQKIGCKDEMKNNLKCESIEQLQNKSENIKKIESTKNIENIKNIESTKNIENLENNTFNRKIIKETKLEKISRELEILKQEINLSLFNSNYQYLIDFEKKNINFIRRKKIINLKNENKISLKNRINLLNKYFYEILNLPYHYVLKESDRIVSVKEFLKAEKEKKNLKVLKKIYKIRKKGIFENLEKIKNEDEFKNEILKLDAEKDENNFLNQKKDEKNLENNYELDKHFFLFSDFSNIQDNKKICSILAYEAKRFILENTIYFDDEIKILDFPIKYVFTEKKEKIKSDKYKNITLDSSKSIYNYKLPILKKKGSHTSHLLSNNKVSNEMLKLENPSDVIKFKESEYGYN